MEIVRFVFYYQTITNFVANLMVEINPQSIGQLKFKLKVIKKKIDCHKICNGKLFVAKSLQVWQQKTFGHHIVASLATKNFWSP